MNRFLSVALLAAVLLSACGVLPALNPTATATVTPLPTDTPQPTLTSTPSATPTPTSTSTPDAVATQAAQSTQAADSVLEELDMYLGEKSGIDYQVGHLLWSQTDPAKITLTGPDTEYIGLEDDSTAGDFIFKSDVTWEATGLLVCGAVFRSEANIEKGKQYLFSFLRFSGLPAWQIEVDQYGQFLNSPTDVRFSDALDLDNGATNQFILVARDNEFTLYLNRNREGRYFDYSSQRSEGAFAFFASQTSGRGTCLFENSWIWSMDE
ncbi:MAG TPA: hypothetical protein VFR47_11565 [Anaerolineales bacterium]|nr:hypothetical protein [Anaerolineales bacterium]